MSAIDHQHIVITPDGYHFKEGSSSECEEFSCEQTLLNKILKILRKNLSYAPPVEDAFSALTEAQQKEKLHKLALTVRKSPHLKRPKSLSCKGEISFCRDKATNDPTKARINSTYIQIDRLADPQQFLPALPAELVQHVLTFLALPDLARVAQVSLHALEHYKAALTAKANLYWYNEAIFIDPAHYFKSVFVCLDVFKSINLISGHEQTLRNSILNQSHQHEKSLDELSLEGREKLEKQLKDYFLHPNRMYEQANGSPQEIANSLLNFDIDVNMRDKQGRTALHYSVWKNNPEVTRLLLMRGADPDILEEKGHTPTDLAVGHPQLLSMLLEFGADPIGIQHSHLIGAVAGNHVESVRILLAQRSNPNIKNMDGLSALYWAVAHEHPDIVAELLNYNANPNITDHQGSTPLYACADDGEMADMLIRKGARVNHKNANGDTPLHLAAARGHCSTIQALLKAGASPLVSNKQGVTPLDNAEQSDIPMAFKMLKDWEDMYDGDCQEVDEN